MKSLGLVCCWVSKLSTGVLFLQQAADDGGALSVRPASDCGVNPAQSTKITERRWLLQFTPHCLHTVPEFLCLCVYCFKTLIIVFRLIFFASPLAEKRSNKILVETIKNKPLILKCKTIRAILTKISERWFSVNLLVKNCEFKN